LTAKTRTYLCHLCGPPGNRVTYLFMTTNQNAGLFFNELGLAKSLLSVLEQQKFVHPTPIQHQCIPLALAGNDVVGIAQTGTGKTLAFGLPMIQRLSQEKGQGLILLPTRELALQVEEVLQKIGHSFGLKTAVLIGGAPIYRQSQALKKKPHIIVATPGRIIDHLQQKNLTLDDIKVLVLDEADRMLDIGFMPQIKQILKHAPKERQTLLFSATMPSAIAELSAQFMKMPLRIEVAPSGTPAANVEQEIFIVRKEAKMQLLEKVLVDNPGSVLLFSRTKFGAKRIAAQLRAVGQAAVEIHSNRSLAQRRAALDGFKKGTYRILVATDIAARGIDVNNIAVVINFDLPDVAEDYVHRIGRTGRAGNSGKAVTFATPGEEYDIRKIEKIIKKTIPILSLPTLAPKSTQVVELDKFYEPQQEMRDRRARARGFNPEGRGSRGASRGYSSEKRDSSRTTKRPVNSFAEYRSAPSDSSKLRRLYDPKANNGATQDSKAPSGATTQRGVKSTNSYFNKPSGYTGFNKRSKKFPSSKRAGGRSSKW